MKTTTNRIVMALLMAVAVMVSNTILMAQEISGVNVVEAPQLTSVGAVVVAAIFGTWMLKKMLKDVPVANQIPVWIYVCSLSVLFTFLANRIFGTLEGDFWVLAWNGVYNGAAASGLREWVYSGPATPLKDSAASMGR